MFESSLELLSCHCTFQTSYKDCVAIFASVRSKYNFILSNFATFESLKGSISTFRWSILKDGLVSFNSYFFSHFSFFSKLLLNNT